MATWLDLDGSGAEPLYRQLARQLEDAIRNGEIDPCNGVGNEVHPAVQCGVSRATMRQAIGELVDRGLLVRRRGHGTHVVGAPPHRPGPGSLFMSSRPPAVDPRPSSCAMTSSRRQRMSL